MTSPLSTSLPPSAAVLLAAGASTRMGGVEGQRKPLLELAGRSLLEHCVAAFASLEAVRELVIVSHADDLLTIERWCAELPAFAKVVAVVPGGATRHESVARGLFWCDFKLELVAVHDAARPLIESAHIASCLAAAAAEGAALLAVPVRDTLKRSPTGTHTRETVDRTQLWAAQTPQAFRLRPLRELVRRAAAEAFAPTDDSALWERYAGPVALVEGSPRNFKITTPDDLALARALSAKTPRPQP